MRLSERRQNSMVQNLKGLIDTCFDVIAEGDLKEVVNATGLSLSTLYRIRGGGVSLRTHVGTLFTLASAAGLKVDLESVMTDTRF